MSSAAPSLVGRQVELALVGETIARATHGRGSVLLVHGEPGIGKSALARAFAAAAEQAGCRVAWGSAWEAGGAPPFWPWVEVLREVIAGTSDAVLGEIDGLGAIVELIPELAGRIGDAKAPPALDPAAARFRVFDTILRLLRRAAQDRPLAIVLDDLHAADLPSLELLHFVATGVHKVAIAVLGTHRDAEPRLDAPIGEALARVRRHADTTALVRLERAAVRELATRWHSDPSEGFVDALVRTTEGNPLFVIETLRLRGSASEDLARGGEGVANVLRERIARLPAQTVGLLEIGAAIGREFDIPWLALAADTTVEVVRDALRVAIAADVIAERDADRFAFTHVLLRDALYRGLAEPRRVAIHRALGLALERRVGADPRTRLVGLARHFIAAMSDGGAERALAYACRAAERAVELQAHEEAVAILERLAAGLDAMRADDSLRIDAMIALGQACIRGGEVARGQAACRRAAELARERGDAERLAAAALVLGEQFTFAVVDPGLVALLREALAAIGPAATPTRARLLARLAAALQPCPEPETPMALAREAIALVREVGDPATRLAVLTSAGSALLYFADPHERIPINREIVEIATVLDDQVRRARGEQRLVFDMIEIGDLRAADRHVAAYASIAEALALPTYRWTSRMLCAMRATIAGRFTQAERLATEAAALDMGTESSNVRLGRLGQRACLLVTATRWEELAAMEPELRAGVVGIADAEYARPCMAAIAARLGRLAEVRRELAELAPLLHLQRHRVGVAWVAEACVAVGDRTLAPALLDLLQPFAGRWLGWGVGMLACEGPVTETLGKLARLLGRHDDAIAWLDDARARCEGVDAEPHRARVLVELAAALRDRAAPGDEVLAQSYTTTARSIVDALGMPGLAVRIAEAAGEREAAHRGPTTTSMATPPQPAFTLVRDGELWAVHTSGAVLRLKDSRGLQILAKLVLAPDRALHVFELLGPDDGERDRGDAGVALDARAIQAYRARAEALRDGIEDAEALGDSERAEALKSELESIAHELARGVGLGGRARREGSAVERARVNVKRRLTDAIGRIAALAPELGRHLEWAVKTGVFCSYHPAGPRLRSAPRGRD